MCQVVKNIQNNFQFETTLSIYCNLTEIIYYALTLIPSTFWPIEL